MTEPRIRVLHAAHGLGLGGTEKVLQLLVRNLAPQRFDVSVFAFSDGPRGKALRQAGIPTHIGPDMGRALAAVSPHIVHIHRAGWPEPHLTRPLKGSNAVVVETNVFGRHDPSPWGQVVRCHLFVSRFCADRFARETGIPADPPAYRVLYNPVDTDFLARACPQRPLDAPVVGRLSRPDPGKWSPLALDFLPELAASVPGLRYRVVGGIPQAEDFVRRHGLQDIVDFLPPLTNEEELAGFLNSISVLAHANDTGESFGLAIAEAMAAGLPVVTHPCPAPRDNAQLELVGHEVTGLVAASTQEYAAALKRLLHDPAMAGRMGEAGRKKAAMFYRAQDIAGQLASIYIELLSGAAA